MGVCDADAGADGMELGVLIEGEMKLIWAWCVWC